MHTIKITINNRIFLVSEEGLEKLNAVLDSEQFMPVREKYNNKTEAYEIVLDPESPRKLVMKQITEWK